MRKSIVDEVIPETQPPVVQSPHQPSIREQYIRGELFHQGEFVRHKTTKSVLQVVECCSNYLRVVDHNGQPKRVWLDAVEKIVPSKGIQQSFVAEQKGDQLFFKGFKTKNFTRSMCEAFIPLLENSDPFAVLSALKFTDKFFAESSVVEKHHCLEQSGKFLSKLNISEHTYRDSMEAQVAEMLLENIPDILKITKNDKSKTAKLIASAVDVSSDGSPEEIINRAAKEIAKGKHSPEVLEIFGQMLGLADQVGIQWNREIFTPKQLESLNLKETAFDYQWLVNTLSEAAQSISCLDDVIDLYEAHEIVIVQGNVITTTELAPGENIGDKVREALKVNVTTSKTPKKIAIKESDPKKVQQRARKFAMKYLRDRAMNHTANKLSEKERQRLEQVIATGGSVITNATKKIFDKLSKIEREKILSQMETEQ